MVRINLSIDENELKEIDEIRKLKKKTRSKIIREAMQLYKQAIYKEEDEKLRKQNILHAYKIQEELKKYTKDWDGVSEIRKWRDSK